LAHAVQQDRRRRVRDVDQSPAMAKKRRSASTGSASVASSTARTWAPKASTAGTPRATPLHGGSTMVSDRTCSGRSAAAYMLMIAP
jgi:hypothetical protein